MVIFTCLGYKTCRPGKTEMVRQNTGHRDSSKNLWLLEEDLASFPESDLGRDKTLLSSCMHIYGAICYIYYIYY